jgi:hypothetical protein
MTNNKHDSSSTSGVFNKKNKWLLWVGVILMLLAMVAYVVTLDESEIPGEGGEVVPAEAP